MKNIFVKVFALILALNLCFLFAACGTDSPTDDTDDRSGGDGDTYAEMDYMTENLEKYVKLGQYKGLEVNSSRPIVSEEDIEEELQALIDAYTSYEPYDEHVTDRATFPGDFVNIDYVGRIDGEIFEGGSNEGDSIVLTENNGFIDWFDDDLYGVMPGITVVTTGNFSENYYEELAGKEVVFEITVNYIAGHYTIPELTDEFVKEKTGKETFEEYKEFLRDLLQQESDAEYEITKLQAMWQIVLDNAEVINLPESQVMYYYTSSRSYYEAYASQYGYTYEEFLELVGLTDNYIYEVMQDRVKEEITFYSIVKIEGIEVTDEDYANGIIQYAADQGMSESALVEEYGEEYIRECVLWDKLMVYLASENTFTE